MESVLHTWNFQWQWWRLWHLEKERTHQMEGHVCYGEKQLCGQGTPFGREIFLIPHSCDSKGWHLLILLSTLFFLTYQHYMTQVLGIWRKSNWRELGEKEMKTRMRKPSWPQLREQCYQARKFGAIFISRKTQKWAQMPPLPIHAQILSQNLTQRGKNEPNTYMYLAKSLTKEPSVFLLSLRNNS